MPCNSDYLEATPRERAAKKAAKLIVYVAGRNGQVPPAWAKEAAADYYGSSDEAPDDIPGALCDILKGLSPNRLETVVYGDLRNKTGRELADWWEEHLEQDRRRDETARRESEKNSLRQQALDKLTPEERNALDL